MAYDVTVLLTETQIVDMVERLTLAELTSLNAATSHTRGDSAYIVAASKWFATQKFWRKGKHDSLNESIGDSGRAGTH